jgi:hypothetical protein
VASHSKPNDRPMGRHDLIFVSPTEWRSLLETRRDLAADPRLESRVCAAVILGRAISFALKQFPVVDLHHRWRQGARFRNRVCHACGASSQKTEEGVQIIGLSVLESATSPDRRLRFASRCQADQPDCAPTLSSWATSPICRRRGCFRRST